MFEKGLSSGMSFYILTGLLIFTYVVICGVIHSSIIWAYEKFFLKGPMRGSMKDFFMSLFSFLLSCGLVFLAITESGFLNKF